jgi:PAS domain S-box-containing protein
MRIRVPTGLRARLILLVIVPLLPALGLILVDVLAIRRTSMNRTEDELRHVAHLAATYHASRLDDTRQFLARLSEDPTLRDGDARTCSATLARVHATHPEYPNIGVVGADGTVECSATPVVGVVSLSREDRDRVVRRALDSGGFTLGDFTMGPVSRRPVILAGYPIVERDGSRRRAAVVSLDVEWIDRFAAGAFLAREATISIIARHGRIVARHPSVPAQIGTSVTTNSVYREIVRLGGNGVASGPGLDGVRRLYVSARIPGVEGVQLVVAGMPLAGLYGAADRALRWNLVLLSLVIAFSFVCAWWLGSVTIVDPLRQILGATKRIARGDLSARASVDRAGDEMARVAAAFDHMAGVIEQRSLDDAEAREALRRERDYVRHIIDVTPALVCGVLPDGTTSFVNPAVEATTGYPSSELIGTNWWRVCYPGEAYAQVKRLFEEFASGPVHDFEMDLTTASGTTRTVSWSSMNKLDADGRVEEFIGFGMDITERKRAERERDRFEVQLRQAQKLESIGQLAAGIAHEINTPTQYIGDNIRFLTDSFVTIEQVVRSVRRLTAAATSDEIAIATLRDVREGVDAEMLDYLVEEVPRALSQSLDGVERVSRIVRAMKDFSHPESEDHKPIDVNRAIETTLTVATNEWKFVADAVMDFDPSLPAVMGHPGELNQVLLNLVINAAHAIAEATQDATHGKGLIVVSTRRLGRFAEIRVSDTGTGIDDAFRDRVFDPFFTTKPVGKGTGQGLAICHAIVIERHRGQITFETELGVGTTFIVTIPLANSGDDAVEVAA